MLWYFISTGLSTVALILAVIAVARPQQKVRHVVQQYHDIDTRLDTLEGRVKKLNANHALILGREKLRDIDEGDTGILPGESPSQWKDRMRAQIRSGKLKVGGTD